MSRWSVIGSSFPLFLIEMNLTVGQNGPSSPWWTRVRRLAASDVCGKWNPSPRADGGLPGSSVSPGGVVQESRRELRGSRTLRLVLRGSPQRLLPRRRPSARRRACPPSSALLMGGWSSSSRPRPLWCSAPSSPPPTTPTPTPTGARCHNTAPIPEPFNVLRALSLSTLSWPLSSRASTSMASCLARPMSFNEAAAESAALRSRTARGWGLCAVAVFAVHRADAASRQGLDAGCAFGRSRGRTPAPVT